MRWEAKAACTLCRVQSRIEDRSRGRASCYDQRQKSKTSLVLVRISCQSFELPHTDGHAVMAKFEVIGILPG